MINEYLKYKYVLYSLVNSHRRLSNVPEVTSGSLRIGRGGGGEGEMGKKENIEIEEGKRE